MRKDGFARTAARYFLLSIGLASGAIFGNAVSANAADILVPAPIPERAAHSAKDILVPSPRAIAETNRWYLRGDIGWARNDIGDATLQQGGAGTAVATDVTDSFAFGIGAGIYLSPRLRGDITIDGHATAEVEARGTGLSEQVRLSTIVTLANLYLDFERTTTRWTPYVGAGIGMAFNTLQFPDRDTARETTVSFAAAAMAGAALELDEAWRLDLNYRFLYLGDASANATADFSDITSHEFRAGLRYDIF